MFLRKCVHLFNVVAFLFAQNTFAITPGELNDYARFYKDSGLSSGPTKLKDILQKIRSQPAKRNSRAS